MDSREELEADIRKWFAEDYYNDYYSEDDMIALVLGWLDCQATITEHSIRCEQKENSDNG